MYKTMSTFRLPCINRVVFFIYLLCYKKAASNIGAFNNDVLQRLTRLGYSTLFD